MATDLPIARAISANFYDRLKGSHCLRGLASKAETSFSCHALCQLIGPAKKTVHTRGEPPNGRSMVIIFMELVSAEPRGGS